jgi:uncharacterized membrane protein
MFSRVKEFFFHEDKDIRDNRWIFASMLVGSAISLIAALVLSTDAFLLAKNPNINLSCNINSVISCGTVARTTFNSIFGFPNSFLGLMSEPVVMTVAIAGLVGVKFPRLFMFTAQIFYTLGFIFAYYLFFIGLFVIGAICPWCFLVTLSTTFVFFSMSRFNIREGNLYLPENVSEWLRRFVEKDFDKLVLATIIFAAFAILLIKYGSALFGY